MSQDMTQTPAADIVERMREAATGLQFGAREAVLNAATEIEALRASEAALIHDLERQISIANTECQRAEELQRKLDEVGGWQPIETAPTGIAIDIWYAPGQLTPCRIPNSHRSDEGLWYDDQSNRIMHPDSITHWMMPPHTPTKALPADVTDNKAGGLWYRRWYKSQKALAIVLAALERILKNDTSSAANHVARNALASIRGETD